MAIGPHLDNREINSSLELAIDLAAFPRRCRSFLRRSSSYAGQAGIYADPADVLNFRLAAGCFAA